MANVQSPLIQNRANQMLEKWIKASTAEASGVDITPREANVLIKQSKGLSANDMAALREAIRGQLDKSAFTVRPDALQAFSEAFGIPPESIPVSSTASRGAVNNAQVTRMANETDSRVKVTSKEVKDTIKEAQKLPENLREMVAGGLMRAVQGGHYKLDHESRSTLTRFMAQNGATANSLNMDDGAKMADVFKQGAQTLGRMARDQTVNGARMAMAGVVNAVEGNSGLSALDRTLSMGARPMSYAQYVMMNGGSFEEILFAFLLELADKADKKLMEKMEQMRSKETGDKATAAAEGRIKQILGSDEGSTPATPGHAGHGHGGGKVQKVSQQLESLVNSVGAFASEGSKGGAEITTEEATRMVGRLETLPENVQGLLAGSIATAMGQSSMQMQPEARAALTQWGRSVKGDDFDLAMKNANNPGTEHGPMALPLSKSDKLEDKIAAYLVDTLTSDTLSMKEKMAPFKNFRAQIDQELGPVAQNAGPQEAQPQAGANGAGLPPPANTAVAGAAGNGATPQLTPEQAVAEASLMAERPGEAAGGQPTSDTYDQHEIQRLMQERSRVFELLSNIMKALHDMIMTSVRNTRG